MPAAGSCNGWTTRRKSRTRRGTGIVSGNARRVPTASWEPVSGQWLDANGMSTDLFGQSELFAGRWPTSGMTRGGRLYPLPTQEHRTDANGSSSSPGLLPTPMTAYSQREPDEWRAGRPAGNGQIRDRIGDLEIVVKDQLLKTPTAQLAVNGGSQHPDKRRSGRPRVPTLRGSGGAPACRRRAATDGAKGGPNQRGSSGDLMLPSAVMDLLPTPVAHDSANTPENHLRKKPGRSQVTSLQVIVDYGLLPTGGHISRPSGDGSASSDAQPHGQLSLDGLVSG